MTADVLVALQAIRWITPRAHYINLSQLGSNLSNGAGLMSASYVQVSPGSSSASLSVSPSRSTATRPRSSVRLAGNYPALRSTAWSAGYGTGASAANLAITIEPLRELAPRQRRQLDDQVALVGVVVQGKPR